MTEGDELPAGWAWGTLQDLGSIVSGGTPKSKDQECFDGDIAWVTPADLTGYTAKMISRGRRNLSAKGLATCSAKVMPKRSVLFSSRAPIGYVAIAANDMATNQGFKSVIPHQEIDESYLYHYLKSAKQLAEEHASGTTFKEISGSRFARLPIPVAPLPEQQRIVEKIETLFAELDKGEEALREVQKLLARYRQSVLKAAVTGTFTADWRAANGPPAQTGCDLLAVVQEKRAKTARHRQPMAPKVDENIELPSSWAWASLDALLIDGPTNGVSPKQADDGGTPSFKLTATTSGKFIINDDTVKQVNIEPAAESKFWLKAGDVLIQRGNTIEYVGTAAVFPGPDNHYIYPDLMMRVRFIDEVIAAWAVAWINFEYAKRHFRSLATGTAGNMPKINGTTLKTLAIPIPPFAEIRELMQRLDENLSKVAPIAAWCETELKRSSALRQSILKDAFSGKLVPQDPSDEPADKLLERIRGAHTGKPTAKRKKAAA